MNTAEAFIYKLFLLGMTLWGLTANAQDYITKSGSRVLPANSERAIFTPSNKQAAANAHTAGSYLVVTRPDLLKPLQPFLKWKRQQGYHVETIVSDTHLCDSIRLRLKERYLAASAMRPAQQYVLIVGDVDRIQSFVGRHTPSGLGTSITDLYYGEYTGDYIPEAFVGRLSVADSSQLADVVTKIVSYEKGMWAEEADRLLLAAGSESRSPAPTTTNGQIHYLAQLSAQHRPYLDTVCFRNPSSAQLTDSILSALRHSNAIVNYTAHCIRSGWNSPSISYHDIDSLENATPTLFINNCCLSNAFDGTCFGELLLCRPTGGAAGVIGATNETLWTEDYYWAVGAKYPATPTPPYDNTRPGAFDSLLIPSDKEYTLGAMLYAGCKAVSQSGSPFDSYYWETYSLLGDPSMTPFIGSPDTLRISVVSPLAAGTTSLQVACPPHTRISATQDTLLLATAASISDSIVTLTLRHALSGDSITLTATRPAAVAQEATLPIVARPKGFLAATSYQANDSLLHINIKNVGLTPATEHTLTLEQTDEDRARGSSFNSPDPIVIPRLNPLADTTVIIELQGYTMGVESLISATLEAYDSLHNSYNTTHITASIPDNRPHIVGIKLFDPSMNAIQSIAPNQHYYATATFSHPTDSATIFFNGEKATVPASPQSATFPLYWEDDGSSHLHLSLTAHKGAWTDTLSGWLVPYSTYERFESGLIENPHWTSGAPFPWTLDSTFSHSGQYSIRSATINHSQKSTLGLMVETLADDSITFYFNVSSEARDWLYFYVDGRRCGFWSGNSGWRYYARPLPAGKHLLQWVYQKDASTSERNDCAHVDDIRIPLALWEQPFGKSENHSQMGITTLKSDDWCKIYPNPTSGLLNIELAENPQSRIIEIFDITGNKVDEILIAPHVGHTQYSTTFLRLGVYLLALHDDAGKHIYKLIVTN